ncbi:MAG: 2-oxoacid:ferredoxin oxidoreductase subunit gamma [Deltaproteobacteria bacterium]|nr:2-oxoacid:ferredoxin oxidoreductase subunit gamma [Deltaproteobacteria bacterium]
MANRVEVRFSGSGGQGIILAGVILAEAAAIYDDKNAVQSQSYGPEARGGASKAEVIISDGEIDYPKATNIDILLALTQVACDKYSSDVKKGGVVIIDPLEVKKAPKGEFKVYSVPIFEIAQEKIGRRIVANIVALGAVVGLTDVVTRAAIEEAVLSRVPRGTEDLNLKALKAGLDAAERIKSS